MTLNPARYISSKGETRGSSIDVEYRGLMKSMRHTIARRDRPPRWCADRRPTSPIVAPCCCAVPVRSATLTKGLGDTIGHGPSLGCPEGWILDLESGSTWWAIESSCPGAVEPAGRRRRSWRLSTRPEKDDEERRSRRLGGRSARPWASAQDGRSLLLSAQIQAAGARG